jgi:hypothetical protein
MKLKNITLALATLLITSSPAVAGPKKLKVTSQSFTKGASIPTDFSCQGVDVSPQLSFSGAPKGTKSIAIVLADPDAPGGTFYHWGRYNIPTSVKSLAVGVKKGSAKDAKNDFGTNAYNGPCPPSGQTHRYIFSVYALSKKLPPVKSAADLALDLTKGRFKGSILASGSTSGIFAIQLSPQEQCFERGGTWGCSFNGSESTCSCQ